MKLDKRKEELEDLENVASVSFLINEEYQKISKLAHVKRYVT